MIDQVEGTVTGVPFKEALGMEGGRGGDLIKKGFLYRPVSSVVLSRSATKTLKVRFVLVDREVLYFHSSTMGNF